MSALSRVVKIQSSLLVLSLQICAFSRSIAIASLLYTNYAVLADRSEQEERYSLDLLRERVELGEYQIVADEVSNQINEIRELNGNFDESLAEPYIVLGDAQLGLGEAEDAVKSFTAALNVTRMNEGLHSTDQLTSLYRISGAMTALGDFQNANDAQERAYAIMRNQLGAKNPQLLPSMLKLIDWYESNRRYSAAKILYI